MAQKVQIVLIDDIDGGPADETVYFSLDGVSYEIDLSAPNAVRLRSTRCGVRGARPQGPESFGCPPPTQLKVGQERRDPGLGAPAGPRGQRAGSDPR